MPRPMRHKVLEMRNPVCPEDLHFYGTLQPAGDPNPSRVKPSSRAEKMQQNSTTSSTWYPFFLGTLQLDGAPNSSNELASSRISEIGFRPLCLGRCATKSSKCQTQHALRICISMEHSSQLATQILRGSSPALGLRKCSKTPQLASSRMSDLGVRPLCRGRCATRSSKCQAQHALRVYILWNTPASWRPKSFEGQAQLQG